MKLTHILPLPVPFYRQQQDDYCGVACLQMVLGYWGVLQDQSSLFQLSEGIPKRWTTLGGLTRAAKLCGLRSIRTKNLNLCRMATFLGGGVPLIARVKPELLYQRVGFWSDSKWIWSLFKVEWGLQPDVAHGIVVIGMSPTEVIFHDPKLPENNGREVICPRERFLAAWGWTGKGAAVIIREHKRIHSP